jgi:hypothetical protein
MQTLPFSYHELHTNNTQNYSQPKAFQNLKLPFSQTFYSYHNFVQKKWKVPFKVTNTSLNTNQKGNYLRNFKRETIQETSKGKLLKKLQKGNY